MSDQMKLEEQLQIKDKKIKELERLLEVCNKLSDQLKQQVLELEKKVEKLMPIPIDQEKIIQCTVKTRSKGQIRHRSGFGFSNEKKTIKIKQADLPKLTSDPELIVEVKL